MSDQIVLELLRHHGDQPLGDRQRQRAALDHILLQRFGLAEAVQRAPERRFVDPRTGIADQGLDRRLTALLDQRLGKPLGDLRTLGHGDLLGVRHPLQQVGQIRIGQHFGILQHRQGDAVDVRGEGHRHVMGQAAGRLQVECDGFAYDIGGVFRHAADDVLGDPALLVGQGGSVQLAGDLGGHARTAIRRFVGEQVGDVFRLQIAAHRAIILECRPLGGRSDPLSAHRRESGMH